MASVRPALERRAPSIRRRSPRQPRRARALAGDARDAGARRASCAGAAAHDRDLIAQLNEDALAVGARGPARADRSPARPVRWRAATARPSAAGRCGRRVTCCRCEASTAGRSPATAPRSTCSSPPPTPRARAHAQRRDSDAHLPWRLRAGRVCRGGPRRLRRARRSPAPGRLDTNVGNVLYRQDRFAEALDCYRRAHAALAARGEPSDVGIVLRNIAVCWISLNDFSGGARRLQRGAGVVRAARHAALVAEADYNVAYLHYLRGDYAAAIELYRAAREYCDRVGRPYHRALCDLDQSEMYLELNLNEEAGTSRARGPRVPGAAHAVRTRQGPGQQRRRSRALGRAGSGARRSPRRGPCSARSGTATG